MCAYIPNGSCPAAQSFSEDCARCKYGEKHCPIAYIQVLYNYDACNNELARAIMDKLVDDDGNCKVLECFKADLLVSES